MTREREVNCAESNHDPPICNPSSRIHTECGGESTSETRDVVFLGILDPRSNLQNLFLLAQGI